MERAVAGILEVESIFIDRYQTTVSEAVRRANGTVNGPHHLQTLDARLVRHMQSLIEGVDIDLDAPLAAEDE